MALISNILSALWMILFFLNSRASGEPCANPASHCKNVVCPELLTCNFPKKAVDYCEPTKGCCMKRECTCKGTNNGLSSTSSVYNRLLTRYTNCTKVEGNVELPGIWINITFTKHIEEVTGYILITRISANHIDFSSLRLIRGNTLYQDPPISCEGSTYAALRNSQPNFMRANRTGYALYVVDNTRSFIGGGFKELWMPNLAGILRGNVNFAENRHLCFVNTIKWSDIFEDNLTQEAHISGSASSCGSCSEACPDDDGARHCWGSSSRHCQLLTKTFCSGCTVGNGRCAVTNGLSGGCCDPHCVGGCYVAYNPKACFGCLTFENEYDRKCVSECPKIQSFGNFDVLSRKKQWSRYCVHKCPANTAQFGDTCQTYCPPGYFDFDGKNCEVCKHRCGHICPGLGVKGTPLENDTYINSVNIQYFNKNCTIIEGSLHFKTASFRGDSFCGVRALTANDLERFSNVREITGYLAFQEWPKLDMCIFKNLRRIRGKEVWYDAFGLMVYLVAGRSNLRELCFNSLKQIDRGVVLVKGASFLCNAEGIEWDDITRDKLGYESEVNSKPAQFCVPCHPSCAKGFGCWGPYDRTQCVKCQNFTDLTDSRGLFAPEYGMNADGSIHPGNNVTTCVSQCDSTKGVYASADKLCLPCHSECAKKCSGPSPSDCENCKHFELNGTCVSSCDPTTHYVMNRTCLPCSLGCRDGGCTGPLDAFDILNGCTACYRYFDSHSQMEVFRGNGCRVCQRIGVNCTLGCQRDASGVFSCFTESLE